MRKVTSRLKRRTQALNGTDVKVSKHVLKWWEFRQLHRIIGGPTRTFLEAGANDGIQQSNSYLFEEYYGWRGILVEPVPTLFEKCKQNRPKAIVENVALVANESKTPVVTIRSCGLMSTVMGGMKSQKEEDDHVRRGASISGGYEEIDVPTASLTSILRRHGVEKLDILMLDVEGYERAVLEGLDIGFIKPKWILVEARYLEDIEEYVGGDYRFVEQIGKMDRLYVRI